MVLGLATVGSVTIAGDATDHVTAWSEDGWQLWRVPTTDVITAVLPLSDAVLVADASGKVVVRDAVTGAQRWSRQLNDVVSVAAVGGHVAVVAGTTLTVLDASTGAPKWRRTLARLTGSPLVVISADVVVTKIDSWLVARDADSGKLVWWRRVDRAAVALRATVDQIVVFGAASTQAIAPDGGLRWSTTPALTVQQSGTLTALTYSDRVEPWGAAGRVGQWRYPSGYGDPAHDLVITDRGVLMHQPGVDGSGWWEYR